MQSLSEDEKRQVLGSVLADQLKAIQDAISNVPEIKSQLDKLDRSMSEMADDLKVVKAAMTHMSNQVNEHEQRIGRLETA
ncbi:hypothetical protein M1512_04490 [Patescibacteria group bacterium]|nr:hypothetical protein [Patescibacteria group bacterium]